MDANDYQAQAARTLITDTAIPQYGGRDMRLVWNAIGLAGEAGETCEIVKKAVFHAHGLNQDALIKELGDVAWYLAALCTVLGIPLSTVLETNIAKLQKRYPSGWSVADSKHGGAT